MKMRMRMKKKTTRARVAGRAEHSARPSSHHVGTRNVTQRRAARPIQASTLLTTPVQPVNTHAHPKPTHTHSSFFHRSLGRKTRQDAPIPLNTWDILWEKLEESDGMSTAYVYRLDAQDKPQKPYLLRCGAWPGLPATLRDEHGGGSFLIMIRRGRKMVFTGTVSIEAAHVKG